VATRDPKRLVWVQKPFGWIHAYIDMHSVVKEKSKMCQGYCVTYIYKKRKIRKRYYNKVLPCHQGSLGQSILWFFAELQGK
jgi:hypothetical protein